MTSPIYITGLTASLTAGSSVATISGGILVGDGKAPIVTAGSWLIVVTGTNTQVHLPISDDATSDTSLNIIGSVATAITAKPAYILKDPELDSVALDTLVAVQGIRTRVGGAAMLYTGTGAPSSSLGITGDIYRDYGASPPVEYKKGATTWAIAATYAANIKVSVFTASDVLAFQSWTQTIMVEMVGAGGGGGQGFTSAANTGSAGAGGGAGAYVRKTIPIGTRTTATITIGAPGTGGVGSSNTNATAGGTTTYADGTTTVSAHGGNPGGHSATATYAVVDGATGGSGAGGDINANGSLGGSASCSGATFSASGATASGGQGAESLFGGGGQSGFIRGTTAASDAGLAATGFGSGGGGGAMVNSTTGAGVDGGDGAGGLCIVTEFG